MMKFVFAALGLLFAVSAQAQVMSSKPDAVCYTAAGAVVCPAILSWDVGTTTHFARYAIYRNKTDSCTGALDGVDPGTQVACPIAASGKQLVLLTTSGAGCMSFYHYSIWGTNKACVDADPAQAQFNNVVALHGLTVYPAP